MKLSGMIAALGVVGMGLVAACSSSSAGGGSGQPGANGSGTPSCSATATDLVIDGLSQTVNITGVFGALEFSNTSVVFSASGGSEGVVGTQLIMPDTGTLQSGQDLTTGVNGTVFRIRANGGSFGTLSETLDNGSKVHIDDIEGHEDGGGLPTKVRISFDGTTSGHAVSGCETYINGA